jgi:GNAT superfamily N-acetyltransferase
MKIYEARGAEVRKVAEFMRQFEQATSFVKVDVDYTTGVYMKMIEQGIAAFLVLEDEGKMLGGLGCLKFPDIHSGEMMAVETFWFMAPESRGKGLLLLDAFEAWGARQGCRKLAMIHLADSYPKALERLYSMRGYKLIEKHYVKAIGEV